jgi:hypothetical protein
MLVPKVKKFNQTNPAVKGFDDSNDLFPSQRFDLPGPAPV